jgi:hypothetical protein
MINIEAAVCVFRVTVTNTHDVKQVKFRSVHDVLHRTVQRTYPAVGYRGVFRPLPGF